MSRSGTRFVVSVSSSMLCRKGRVLNVKSSSLCRSSVILHHRSGSVWTGRSPEWRVTWAVGHRLTDGVRCPGCRFWWTGVRQRTKVTFQFSVFLSYAYSVHLFAVVLSLPPEPSPLVGTRFLLFLPPALFGRRHPDTSHLKGSSPWDGWVPSGMCGRVTVVWNLTVSVNVKVSDIGPCDRYKQSHLMFFTSG